MPPQTINISHTIQAGVDWQTQDTVIPNDINNAALVFDDAWLSDPTARLHWGIERSFDNGQTWISLGGGFRSGGVIVDKFTGDPIPVNIHVYLGNIHGQRIRASIGYTVGNTGLPTTANLVATLTLS